MENGRNSPNSSPRPPRKFFWSKHKNNKIEPQPLSPGGRPNSHIENNVNKSDMSFAKCSPQRKAKKQPNELIHSKNSSQLNHKLSFIDNSSQIENNSLVSNNINNSNNISNYEGNKERPVNFRVKTNNSNNVSNRFSHQFSLCCKADRRPSTPPQIVSVRYNSLPEVINHREQMLLNFSENPIPLAEISECNSAPETPMAQICQNSHSFNSHSSPSTNSVQSTRSDGQPRSIAMQACRSRLRLKLMPPGKLIENDKNDSDVEKSISNKNNDTINNLKKYPDQHVSSPDITTQCETSNSEAHRSISFEGIIKRAPSGSSDLVRQALMAAQVLSLIPTEKARQRNYLANRIASSSLLGASELIRIIPNKGITIYVGTWNMNGQTPPKQMNDFVLPSSIEHVPDLIAVGTQESCPERFEWEVILQETIGPSHVLFHAASLGTLHLAIFLRRDLIWFCSVPEDASLSVRPGTVFRTKGAVAISFCLFGTSMLFVTSHLTAHQQKVKERVQDVKRIINALDLPKNLNIRHKNKDVTQNFDSVYWCGDLNFRLAEPREKLLKWIENTKFPLPSHLPNGMLHTDQLSSILSDGAAFKGFMEHKITFPPSYKYDPGTQQFDTSSKQRAPAYTDRILFKYKQQSLAGLRRTSTIAGTFLSSPSSQQTPIVCLAYDSVPSIISSDHKPVWALFKNQIKPGIDSIPLAAGLFVRDVYVEGMRRRLNNSYSDSSVVCTIQ